MKGFEMTLKLKTRKMFFGALVFTASAALLSAAVHITQAQLGTGRTDDYKIVNPTTEFASTTPAIFCVWRADGLKIGAAMRGVWIAEDVGKVAPPNYKIDEAAVKTIVANEGYFSLSKPTHGFPVGKYRLEIYSGADLVKTVPFTVRAK
jgi:hypothetical protein